MTPQPLGPELLAQVRAGFILLGTTFSEWCQTNQMTQSNCRQALLGSWDGPKARALRTRILEAARVSTGDIQHAPTDHAATDFDATMERLKAALGARNFAETGRALGFSTSAYANRKRTGSVPYEQIVALAFERGIDLNWLLCGAPRAAATQGGDASTAEQLAAITAELKRTNERLARIEEAACRGETRP